MYEKEFTKIKKVISVLWSNKSDSGLWFGPAEWKECRLGIKLLPLLPVSEVLSSDVERALQGIYDNESALQKIRKSNVFDEGNSLIKKFLTMNQWIKNVTYTSNDDKKMIVLQMYVTFIHSFSNLGPDCKPS